MTESWVMSFLQQRIHKLVTPTMNTFLSFYVNFTNGGEGRKGAMASRSIQPTGSAVVFLLGN